MNYQKIYEDLIERGRERQGGITQRAKIIKRFGYMERHHILPKCLGGNNDPTNLVFLTGREHFIAHLLLTFIHKNSYPIHNAMTRLLYDQKGDRLNGHSYQWVKIKLSNFNRARNKHNCPSIAKMAGAKIGKTKENSDTVRRQAENSTKIKLEYQLEIKKLREENKLTFLEIYNFYNGALPYHSIRRAYYRNKEIVIPEYSKKSNVTEEMQKFILDNLEQKKTKQTIVCLVFEKFQIKISSPTILRIQRGIY
jgi:hypothetical protein